MPSPLRSRLALVAVTASLAACGSAGGGNGESTSTKDSGGGSDLDSGGVKPDSGSDAAGSTDGGSQGPDGSAPPGPDAAGTPDAGTDSGGTKPDTGTETDAGKTAACAFASGLNIAWVNFANDVPNPDIATFTTIFNNAYAAGGRVIRWWFHTNGTVTPGYQASGLAQDLPATHVAGIKSILAAANKAGVAVNISLWSFDMLQGSEGISAATLANNLALLQNDTNRQAYITNYLTPLVTQLKGTPGLYSYEIFNEPEGMGPDGWATGGRTTEAYIQTCVNQFAAAIHAADPDVLVTNGSQTFDYCSNAPGKTNYYSDTALKAAGGMATGTLDFYEVHYYTSNGTSDSCFMHPASYWGLDKKLVMGEFYAATTDGVSQDDTYTYLYTNGYNGAWAWSYESDMPWPSMQVPMQDLYTADTATVGSCP